MNSLQYDTAELLTRFTAPSTLADEVIRLRARLAEIESQNAVLFADYAALNDSIGLERRLNSDNLARLERLTKLYRAVKSSGLRHNYLLKQIMDEIEQQPTP